MGELEKTVTGQNSIDVDVGLHESLEKRFSYWSTLGAAFSFMATPLSIGSYLVFSLSAGGSPYFFYGVVLAFFMNTLTALSLCEIAAVFPHTSGTSAKTCSYVHYADFDQGQIFWTSSLAPPSASRALGYACGAATMTAWVTWTAGTWLFAANILAAFIELCGSAWRPTTWQILLLYFAFALFAVGWNTVAFKWMPALCKGMIFWINGGSLLILVALLVRAQPKQSAAAVFVDTVNYTGWTSDGVVFFLALLPGITATVGFDAASHLTDEMPNPARQVPLVMLGTILLCGFAGIPMTIVFLFCNVRPDNLLAPIGGQPIMQLFVDAMDSYGLSVASSVVYVGVFTFASATILTTASRCWWSFAVCDAFPAGTWQGKVGRRFQVPTNSIAVVTGLCIVIGLLELGPTTVLTSVVATAAICFYLSYSLPIACMLFGGRKTLTNPRFFNLGKAGVVINIISLCWSAVTSVFLCFPTVISGLTLLSMSYTSVVVVVAAVVFGLNWIFYARKAYSNPVPLYSA